MIARPTEGVKRSAASSAAPRRFGCSPPYRAQVVSAAGEYYVGYLADANNALAESLENNN